MIERGTGNKRHIYLGEHRTRDVILPVVHKYVVPGATIHTDNFTAYWTLNREGFVHSMVNHSVQFVDSHDPSIHTETIEGNFKHMKRMVNKGCGVRDEHLQTRLNEFDFRSMYFKNKKKRYQRMVRLLGIYGARVFGVL